MGLVVAGTIGVAMALLYGWIGFTSPAGFGQAFRQWRHRQDSNGSGWYDRTPLDRQSLFVVPVLLALGVGAIVVGLIVG